MTEKKFTSSNGKVITYEPGRGAAFRVLAPSGLYPLHSITLDTFKALEEFVDKVWHAPADEGWDPEPEAEPDEEAVTSVTAGNLTSQWVGQRVRVRISETLIIEDKLIYWTVSVGGVRLYFETSKSYPAIFSSDQGHRVALDTLIEALEP